VKFFFPDSQDFVAPGFDFVTERHAGDRMRLRDDRYAHEIFKRAPFDGLLVSKAIVEGSPGASGKYTLAQRHRLLRSGVRRFFRLDESPATTRLKTIGDCGAFSYVREKHPPFTVDSVIDFYTNCDFDFGISVDHVILDYNAAYDSRKKDSPPVPDSVKERQSITLALAGQFLGESRAIGARFVPVGVAQGWSPRSYARAVTALQRMGYNYIALGGMVPLKTADIHAVLEEVDGVRKATTQLHLLGITRIDSMKSFAAHGVASFDSTSPFRRAFKDATDNYFTATGNFTALRVPQVEGNRQLHVMVAAGRVNQAAARRMERDALAAIRGFDKGTASKEEVLESLAAYNHLCDDTNEDRLARYGVTLDARPWQDCPCDICRTAGVEVIIFRGSERNKRRGFHNIWVTHEMLRERMRPGTVASPKNGPPSRAITTRRATTS